MALISLQETALKFSGPLIFDRLSLHLDPGERVALLGRNGAGKTTMMKVMAGQIAVDDGIMVYNLISSEDLGESFNNFKFIVGKC